MCACRVTVALLAVSLLLSAVAPAMAQVEVYSDSFEPGWAAPTWPTWGWETPLFTAASSGDWTPECSDVWAVDPNLAQEGLSSLRLDATSTTCLPNGVTLLIPSDLEEGSISLWFYDDLSSSFELAVSDVNTGASGTSARLLTRNGEYQTRIGSSADFRTAAPRAVGWHLVEWISTVPSFDRLDILLDEQSVASTENPCTGCSLRHLRLSCGSGSLWVDELSVVNTGTGPIPLDQESVGRLKSNY